MAAGLLQLKLTLADIKPPIWRRLYVSNQITLERLHQIIQKTAGWSGTQEHEFVIADKRYGTPAPREIVPVQNEALFRLHSLPLEKGVTFNYVYDFEDRWKVEVKVESFLPRIPGMTSIQVLEGERAFPPEDSGGAEDYEIMLDILSDPDDPEHEEFRLWVGEDFDPESVDLPAEDERLQELFAG